MRLLWSPRARSDLISIRRYIAQHNPTAANGVARRILDAASSLREQPYLGLGTQRENVRRLIVAHTVYSLIYRISGDDIEIIEAFDGRREAPRTDIEG